MSYKFDAAIVLACGIKEDGSLPDDPKASVDIAADLYNSGRTKLIIFSGNLSYKADFKPPLSESDAMSEYAQGIGLPRDCLLTENESKDTLGNAYFTKVRYLIPGHLGKLAVILGPNHSLERVKYIFDKVLGDGYETTFYEHNANREGEVAREGKSLEVLKEWIDKIPNGDHEAIHRAMLAKHPGYSPNPDDAWKNLNQRLQN
jgi:uncharacterized SAM-binding protein YcdF (DUF218 family)